MLKKNLPKELLGASALALLFGTFTVQAQTTATPTTDDRAPITGQTMPTPPAGQAGMLPPPPAVTGSTMRAADQRYLKEIAQGNIAEIKMAEMALAKSQDEQVKAFAQKMIDDHTSVLNQVQQLAQAKGVTLPDEMDRKHKRLSDKMSAMTGEQFDRAYLSNAGLGDHKNMTQLLARVEKRAVDPDLKRLAAQTRPAVEQHLHSAQQMRGSSTKGATEAGKK
ncbi:DUF4142 domain-containing protein [Massilia glaciei]|uniref:DUF4142 domain-containing protein n=1 Tax=Massilia glaciei TaxID=1524097 RepID=A0A2U2HIC6_9BURK|nr:DUF4142 domain-containing protein [Massilia glaciei]PWF46092.1 DUF4142 domain-containing protein [Massilia glaciei]